MNGEPALYYAEEIVINEGDDRHIDFPLPSAKFLQAFEWKVYTPTLQPVAWVAYAMVHVIGQDKGKKLRIRFKDRESPPITDGATIRAQIQRDSP